VNKWLFSASIIAAIGAGVASEAMAQANPNQLIAQRKGAMNLQGKYFGQIVAMLQGKVPYDPRIVQRNAEYLAVISQLPWDDFQPHTAGAPNTRTKDELYKDPAKFRSAVENLQGEVQKLGSVARGDDQNAVRTAVQGVARACNGCHEANTSIEWRLRP
jgi:cytochrome c556